MSLHLVYAHVTIQFARYFDGFSRWFVCFFFPWVERFQLQFQLHKTSQPRSTYIWENPSRPKHTCIWYIPSFTTLFIPEVLTARTAFFVFIIVVVNVIKHQEIAVELTGRLMVTMHANTYVLFFGSYI